MEHERTPLEGDESVTPYNLDDREPTSGGTNMLLASGARLGSYEIVDTLGAGGMGEVYRAYDPKLQRHVAIKVLNLASVANAAAVRRFEQEARAASALNHPGIVTIHDTGESDGRFFIVMELVDGATLRHRLRRGPRPLKKALQIASQLADALVKAHEAGVVHRDLKPENVMVTSDDHVKIVDFGLAKLTDRLAPPGANQGSGTESGRGVLLGTVGYMSPEQVRGEPADFRADQFAFGAILYELITGNRACPVQGRIIAMGTSLLEYRRTTGEYTKTRGPCALRVAQVLRGS